MFGVKSVNKTPRPLSWKIKKFWPQPTEDFIYPPDVCLYTGHQPLKDIEIRVGNSSTDLQRNPLCAWFPGTIGEMHANWQLLSLCYLWCTAMNDVFLALIALTTAWFMGSVDLTVLQMEQRVSEPRSLSVFRCKGVGELQVFWYMYTVLWICIMCGCFWHYVYCTVTEVFLNLTEVSTYPDWGFSVLFPQL